VDDGYDGLEVVRWSDGQVKLHFKLLCFSKQRQVFPAYPPIYVMGVCVKLHLLLLGSLDCHREPGEDQKELPSQRSTRLSKVGYRKL
jgi:hypothetical protein